MHVISAPFENCERRIAESRWIFRFFRDANVVPKIIDILGRFISENGMEHLANETKQFFWRKDIHFQIEFDLREIRPLRGVTGFHGWMLHRCMPESIGLETDGCVALHAVFFVPFLLEMPREIA